MNTQVHRHFLLHKPYGYLSQFVNNQNKRRNKRLLSELGDFPDGTMSIGRLDEKSEGLLLLTTDGKLSATVTGKKVEKEYWVEVDGIVTSNALKLLEEGPTISLRERIFKTTPKHVSRISEPSNIDLSIARKRHRPTSWISIVLNEGKFRQVRKMTAALGFPTLRLVRIRIGSVYLNDLPSGNYFEDPDLPERFV